MDGIRTTVMASLKDFEDTVALDTFESKYGDARRNDGPEEEGSNVIG